ncbi:MAG: hypothetical protein HY391_01210 [Deltaproteobacteria bacterium]|nr:hypothetical protein [Deltaproteobacteria bacterium]
MAHFAAMIAFLFALVVAVGGFFVWHLAAREKSTLLRVAGMTLAVISIGTALCVLYYDLRYSCQGDYASPYPTFFTVAEHPGGFIGHPKHGFKHGAWKGCGKGKFFHRGACTSDCPCPKGGESCCGAEGSKSQKEDKPQQK